MSGSKDVQGTLSSDAIQYLESFEDPTTWFVSRWKPSYERTAGRITDLLARGSGEELVDIIWRSQDNHISNAGQGTLAFGIVDRLRDDLIETTIEIASAPIPETFAKVVARFNEWKRSGRVPKVPKLMIARAFAAICPERYHTTVDAGKHTQVLRWFSTNSAFDTPVCQDWPTMAEALTSHLDEWGVFGNDIFRRNIFPWFVFDQLQVGTRKFRFIAGHSPRPSSSYSTLPESKRKIALRHNVLTSELYRLLCEEFDRRSICTDCATGTGGFADAIRFEGDKVLALYEIKVARTAAGAIREAIGQLLEYGLREGGLNPASLIVVAEPSLDAKTERYLSALNASFPIRLEYRQVRIDQSTFIDNSSTSVDT